MFWDFFQLIVDTEFLKMLSDHLFKPRGRKRAEQEHLLNAIGQFAVHNFCADQNFKRKCSFCSPK